MRTRNGWWSKVPCAWVVGIAENIKERVGAKGVFVRSRAVHLCVHSRGPSDHTMETVCTYAVGSFRPVERQAELSQLLAVQAR